MPKVAANGIHIEYESFGRGGNPMVVLIAGLGEQMGGVVFPAEFCRELADCGLRVIRFDNRDVGLSTHFREKDPPNYSLVDMALDVSALIEALGAYGAHLVGVSHGGFIARHLALRFPSLVRSLVLIMTGAGAKPGSESDDRFSSMSREALERVLAKTMPARSFEAAVDSYVETWRTYNGPGFPFDEAWVRSCGETVFLRDYDPPGVARQFRAASKSPPLLEEQSEIRCPTIVMHGDCDPIFGIDHGAEVARRIPGARFERIAGMGHEMPRELWPLFYDAICTAVVDAEAPAATAL